MFSTDILHLTAQCGAIFHGIMSAFNGFNFVGKLKLAGHPREWEPFA